MRSNVRLAVVALLGLLLTPAAAAHAQEWQERGTYAFTNVNVVPMDTERVVADQNVIVRDGRIIAMGPAASTIVPAGATTIDGRGRYLMPGLAEMHGHIPGTNAGLAEDVLFMYVAAGATTVRGMQGHPSQIALRDRVRSGEIVGPRLDLAAPPLGGDIDAATATQRIREAKAAGFDLLKVHEGLSAATYEAIVATARELDMPWGGHVSVHVGVPGALAARQSTIDHIDDYLEAMQPAGSPALSAAGAERQRLMPLHADASCIPGLVHATREAGVAIVPTQILWEVIRGARDPQTMMDRPENRYWPASQIAAWTTQVTNMQAQADPRAAAREVELRNELLKAMSDGGVLILMGTDAPQLFSVPGFSLYRELPVMVEAGMSPYEVLRTGTVNIARFYGIEDEAGTVAAGRRADLLLLEANPLEDIGAIERNAGVMVDGRWLASDRIRARLAELAARNGA